MNSEHPVAHHVISSVGLSANIVLYGAGSLSSRYNCLAAICGIETIVGEKKVCVEMCRQGVKSNGTSNHIITKVESQGEIGESRLRDPTVRALETCQMGRTG